MYLYIGAGGIIGSLFRYLVSVLTHTVWTGEYPLGTLFVNLSGSFLLGWFASKYLNSTKLSRPLYSMIATGMIGSYTTFSTLSLDAVILFEAGDYLTCIGYVVVSLVGGLFLVRMGMYFGSKRENEAGKTV